MPQTTPKGGKGLDAEARVRARLAAVSLADRRALERLARSIRRRTARGQPVSALQSRLDASLTAAEELMVRRRETRYRLEYPAELPVSGAREEILSALRAHQVLVVCGDTGSGKTTQLPKLCLEAGRGLSGAIGHTQPRRIAARAVAARLAEELDVTLGEAVGYQVRFTDQSNPASLVKVMTDGILLNEIRHDRELLRYDTIIIDEAHERSLNIDFLLGFLKQLVVRRADLKVIITSATIDPERFAAHFDDAPIIRVQGRSHPVEIRYRPPARDEELTGAIVRAVEEVAHLDLDDYGGRPNIRDVLVFLPGERWIRDAEQALKTAFASRYEILPLYARLTAARQQRVFHPGAKPRVVLATNVAETSLTVPRIRFVIDTGLARISRYSPRQRIQSLGVEPIARANATQRTGRCGRLAPGVCVRLFAEDDFAGRDEYMPPEILRTDLAGVVLRLEAVGLEHVTEFPFVDPPPIKAINDAYRLLQLLDAVDGERRLTEAGRLMARLPLDPRLARLLLIAEHRGVLREGLVVAAALSVIDPREQPAEELGTARERQAAFNDPRSDFMTALALWQAHSHVRREGQKAYRAWCRRNFLSATRFREWDDVHHQLKELVIGLGWSVRAGEVAVGKEADYGSIHRAILAGFVDFVAQRGDNGCYDGIQGAQARLFPGSGLSRQRPQWVVAAERVATTQVYLRTVAKVQPAWIMDAAHHVLTREYHDAHWDRRRGVVSAREVVGFRGLVVSHEGRVDYGRIDAVAAHELFVREALVADDVGARVDVLGCNRALQEHLLDWEARRRSHDLYAGDAANARFYAEHLPAHVVDRRGLLRWLRDAGHVEQLRMSALDIATQDPATFVRADYPDALLVAGHELSLAYVFDSVSDADGVTLKVPLPLLGVLRPEPLEWLVPGQLPGKVLVLLRSLPKAQRRSLVPLPDTVAALMPLLLPWRARESLARALCNVLADKYRLEVDAAAFGPEGVPREHLLRLAVVDEEGAVIATGRDLPALQRRFAAGSAARIRRAPADAVGHGAKRTDPHRDVRSWDVGTLADAVTRREYGVDLHLYPALIDARGRVDLEWLPSGPTAVMRHRAGVRRLLLKTLPQQTDLVHKRVRRERALVLSYHGIGPLEELVDDLCCAALDEAFVLEPPVRTEAAFAACRDAGRAGFMPAVERLIGVMIDVLQGYRTISGRLMPIQAVGSATALRSAQNDGDTVARRREVVPVIPREVAGSILGRKLRPWPVSVVADIDAQLHGLVHPGFLTATPPPWRSRLPRYLEAINQRLDRIERQAPKDAEYQAVIAVAAERLEAWRLRQPPDWPWPAAVTEYRWLLEELRISLFAQALGTRVPVSAKRLEAAWKAALA